MTQLETMLGVTPVPAENPFHLYLITPEIAAKLLSRKHPRNRKLKDGVVERYAKAMADGHWKDAISSQPISISADGFVQDGHHRLNAIIKSNTSHYMWVVENAEPEQFQYLDNGEKRRTEDYLTQYPNHSILSSMSAVYYCMVHGNTNLKECCNRRIKRNVCVDRQYVLETAHQMNDVFQEYIHTAQEITRAIFDRRYTSNIATAIMILSTLNQTATLKEFLAESKNRAVQSNAIYLGRDRIKAYKDMKDSPEKSQAVFNIVTFLQTYDLFTQGINKDPQVKAYFNRFHQTLDIYTDLLQNFRANNREIAALSAQN